MRFKLFYPVKIIPVGGEDPASVAGNRFRHIYHFGIEFANPLHFTILINRFPQNIITVHDAEPLYQFTSFHNQVAIGSFALVFRNNAKNQSAVF